MLVVAGTVLQALLVSNNVIRGKCLCQLSVLSTCFQGMLLFMQLRLMSSEF